jgi:hypothetical protein
VLISFNGNSYKTVFLDTNAIREIATNTQSASRFFHEQIINNGTYAICFSIYNLIELKGQGEKFIHFCDFFDNWPVLLFHDIPEFYKQEHAAAKAGETLKLEQRSLITPFIPSFVRGKRGDSLKEALIGDDFKPIYDLIPGLVKEYKVTATEWQGQRIGGMISDNEYFKKYEGPSILKSVTDFCGSSDIGKFDINSYPSQRVGLYSQFCRVHKMRRSLEVNDVIDVMLSGYAAFVDVIVTEAFQANVLRILKGRIPSLRSLEVLRLSDIR